LPEAGKVDGTFEVDREASPRVIRVAGRLAAAHVPDFLELWHELGPVSQREVQIDLSL
jgi:hypothetical protein